jgi:beta-mannosidase
VDVPGRGHATLAAESLFPSFLDLTYAYRFGPPGHDLVVASLVESGGDRVLAEAFHFPLGLPASREDDLGLTAEIRHDGPDVRLTLRTRRFAQSVAIEVDGHSAEDNYFHLAPGSRREVRLVPSSPPRTPAGTVTALNGRAVRIVTAS